MSEPNSIAGKIDEVIPGILWWEISVDRIGGAESDAYALVVGGKTVLIDPLPLVEEEFHRLGMVEAICLTGSCHQRSAWRFRRRFGARVYAPRGADGLEEAPDVFYGDREELPGGLRALHAPGPTEVHFAFLRSADRGTMFCADVLTNSRNQGIRFVPDEYQDDPERTRQTALCLLDSPFDTLCFAHGSPIRTGAHGAIREAVKRYSRR